MVKPVPEVQKSEDAPLRYRYDWIRKGMVKHDPERFRKMVTELLKKETR